MVIIWHILHTLIQCNAMRRALHSLSNHDQSAFLSGTTFYLQAGPDSIPYPFASLAESEAQHIQILEQTGFPTIHTFNRVFRKQFGCSPPESRTKQINEYMCAPPARCTFLYKEKGRHFCRPRRNGKGDHCACRITFCDIPVSDWYIPPHRHFCRFGNNRKGQWPHFRRSPCHRYLCRY